MKVLKGFALFVFGSLLYLSLSLFGIAFMLNQTVLNPDFVSDQIERLDVPAIARDIISENLPEEPEGMAEVIDRTITDLEPWFKEQARDVIHEFYDYIKGKNQRLSLVIPLEPVRESLMDNLREVILESPPPELAGLPPDEIERHLDEYYQQITEHIPESFELNEDSIPAEMMNLLGQLRQFTSYFQTGYIVLIGAILFLILLIVLVHHNVRGSTRGLGTNFLICGIFGLGSVLLAKYASGTLIPQADLPTQLQSWVPQLINDILSPLQIYSISLIAIGIVLLIVSFAYKPRQPAF